MPSFEHKLPKMFRIKQAFQEDEISDIYADIRGEFNQKNSIKEKIKVGQKIGIAVGSRGIDHLQEIVTEIVKILKEWNAKPFIIPAMGSHGGATAKGQIQVLAELGVTEKTVSAPIVSNMETVDLGCIQENVRIHFSADAMNADHLIVVNRVKPHTAFRGEVESGLCKMLAIGCGKHKGAAYLHKFDLSEVLLPAAEFLLDKTPFLCGLAVLENGHGKISQLKLAEANEIIDTDIELLKTAWELMPTIPVNDLDILLIDEMGKNISGGGMDPNVIGFWRKGGGELKPNYKTVIVLDLTSESHGNATGIGWADLTTRKLLNKIDVNATYTNALTAGVLRSARFPIALENDREAIFTEVNRLSESDHIRMIRIVNTLSLDTFWASENVLSELNNKSNITIDSKPLEMQFDKNGNLLPMPI